MNFDLPGEDDPRRKAVRGFLEAHPKPSGRQLFEAGYVVPHWPPPYGLDADPIHQLIIDDEMAKAHVSRPGGIGVSWAAPTIYMAGTQEQRDTYLPPTLSGEVMWCQLFSEPDSGSDLASLGVRAERDGDVYVVNGSKIWTSGAHESKLGILLARTDPDAPKHKGISYFICPMDLPGITMTPIIDMTTAHSFNQVFFDDVRLPASLRVGDENDGWRLAKVTLGNERVSLSGSGSLWGGGPSMHDLLGLLRRCKVSDPVLRQRVAALYCEAEALRLIRARTLSARIAGNVPGPAAAVQKLLSDEHGQRVMALAKDLAGAHGMLTGSGPAGDMPDALTGRPTEVNFTRDQYPDVDPVWHYGFLFAPALTLGGGTFAIQRNIVAEATLGLPREPDVERGKTWRETRSS